MTQLFDDRIGYHKKYTNIHTQASMLLAGIGTGGFSLGSRGELKDWGIFNHPDRGNQLPYTFFQSIAILAMKVLRGYSRLV